MPVDLQDVMSGPDGCPGGHTLRRQTVPSGVRACCDHCRETVYAGETVWACRQCNYDKCGPCSPSSKQGHLQQSRRFSIEVPVEVVPRAKQSQLVRAHSWDAGQQGQWRIEAIDPQRSESEGHVGKPLSVACNRKVWPQTTSSLQRAAYGNSDLAGPRVQTFLPQDSPKKTYAAQFLDASLNMKRTSGSPLGDSLRTKIMGESVDPGVPCISFSPSPFSSALQDPHSDNVVCANINEWCSIAHDFQEPIDFDSIDMPEFEMAEPAQYYQCSEISRWCADESDLNCQETEDGELDFPHEFDGSRLADHLQPEAAFVAALSLADNNQPFVVEHTAKSGMLPEMVILPQITDTSDEAQIHQLAEYVEYTFFRPEETAACPQMPQLADHLIVESAFAHVSPHVRTRDVRVNEHMWGIDHRSHELPRDTEEEIQECEQHQRGPNVQTLSSSGAMSLADMSSSVATSDYTNAPACTLIDQHRNPQDYVDTCTIVEQCHGGTIFRYVPACQNEIR